MRRATGGQLLGEIAAHVVPDSVLSGRRRSGEAARALSACQRSLLDSGRGREPPPSCGRRARPVRRRADGRRCGVRCGAAGPLRRARDPGRPAPASGADPRGARRAGRAHRCLSSTCPKRVRSSTRRSVSSCEEPSSTTSPAPRAAASAAAIASCSAPSSPQQTIRWSETSHYGLAGTKPTGRANRLPPAPAERSRIRPGRRRR